jgi:hypothetical protein
MWTMTASLHMEENDVKWLHVYKLKRGLGDWNTFVTPIEEKFGTYDYRKAIQELLSIKHDVFLEDYNKDFEVVQFHVSMFNSVFDDMFFTSHYVNGLRDEIKHPIQSQLPDSVDRASLLARIQQRILEKGKPKSTSFATARAHATTVRTDEMQPNPTNPLWKERQLRDYIRANNLYYFVVISLMQPIFRNAIKETNLMLMQL